MAPIARSVTFNMACARGVIGKDLVIYNVTEPSTCQYVINAASPMACGCESQCFVAGKETRNCGLGASCRREWAEGPASCFRRGLLLAYALRHMLFVNIRPHPALAACVTTLVLMAADGCGGTCSPPNLEGECPYANQIQQVCDYDTGTCCRPDCAGRQCGDDGCGGTVSGGSGRTETMHGG